MSDIISKQGQRSLSHKLFKKDTIIDTDDANNLINTIYDPKHPMWDRIRDKHFPELLKDAKRLNIPNHLFFVYSNVCLSETLDDAIPNMISYIDDDIKKSILLSKAVVDINDKKFRYKSIISLSSLLSSYTKHVNHKTDDISYVLESLSYLLKVVSESMDFSDYQLKEMSGSVLNPFKHLIVKGYTNALDIVSWIYMNEWPLDDPSISVRNDIIFDCIENILNKILNNNEVDRSIKTIVANVIDRVE